MKLTEIELKYPKAEIFGKKYGNGLKPIKMGFNEHRRLGLLYIIFVDIDTNIYDMHDLADEIENDLVDEFGMFDRHEDFEIYCKEENKTNDCFDEWFENQFPAIDIHGGSSNWNEVN